MTNRRRIVSATIVAFCLGHSVRSLAKPTDTIPDQTPAREIESPAQRDENMAISKPPESAVKPAEPPPSNYFSYRQALTFRMGAAAPLSDTDLTETMLGFSYMFPRFLSPRFEAGADVHNKDDKGHVHAGFRKIYFERNRMRPSLKYGLSHEVHAEEGIATFANNKHYFGRGSAALDMSWDQSWFFRLELEILIGIEKQWATGSLGLSRSW